MQQGSTFQGLRWLTTDAISTDLAETWRRPALGAGTLALIQYTSGSTAAPKGVKLSHANLLHNSGLIAQAFGHTPRSRGVIWLPPYHDMGLIGGTFPDSARRYQRPSRPLSFDVATLG